MGIIFGGSVREREGSIPRHVLSADGWGKIAIAQKGQIVLLLLLLLLLCAYAARHFPD